MIPRLGKNSTAVIHQPYFLPWLGYFSKLVYADKFIVLDNVQFSKRKFIDRVQIINTQGERMWVGLPVGGHYKEPCNQIRFSDKSAMGLVIDNLYSAYSKARHFKENIQKIEGLLMSTLTDFNILSDINVNIITGILQLLEVEMPEVIYSSDFDEVADPNDRIVMLCERTDTDTIIVGSKEGIEIHDLEKFNHCGLKVLLQDFYNEHPTYYQTRRTRIGFAKGLSIVDCIFNEGLKHTRSFLYQIPRPYPINSNLFI